MKIDVKLMGTLRSKLPPGSEKGTAKIDVDEGTSIASLLDNLHIPSAHVHLVVVNGAMERDRTRVLKEGDAVGVFPPVAGG